MKDQKLTLIALPYAGGAEYCYKELSPLLENINLVTLALPGRGRLFKEPCISHVDTMTEYLIPSIAPYWGQKYAFFGHSMGAFLAYQLARKVNELASNNHQILAPGCLILSGRKAPSIKIEDKKHLMPQEKFRAALKELGGIPDVVWQDEELISLFEPVIRDDFKLLETFQYRPLPPLEISIRLLLGKDDTISSEQAEAWQQETTKPLRIEYFDGGHFYFQNNWQQLASKINSICAKV